MALFLDAGPDRPVKTSDRQARILADDAWARHGAAAEDMLLDLALVHAGNGYERLERRYLRAAALVRARARERRQRGG